MGNSITLLSGAQAESAAPLLAGSKIWPQWLDNIRSPQYIKKDISILQSVEVLDAGPDS
jgi:hypothetical protein